MNRISNKQKVELAKRRELRLKLLERSGRLCEVCYEPPDFRGLSLSHTLSLARGGQTSEVNCKILCGRCHDKIHGVLDRDA